MDLHLTNLSEEVVKLLRDRGDRAAPLTQQGGCPEKAKHLLVNDSAQSLFKDARAPEAALAGLLLYLGCWEEAHNIAQDIPSIEGSYWHAILHRQDPDAGNSAYWFRRVGTHPTFVELQQAAEAIAGQYPKAGLRLSNSWNPFSFIEWCEEAREQPGSDLEKAALAIQDAEWRILFQWCAEAGVK